MLMGYKVKQAANGDSEVTGSGVSFWQDRYHALVNSTGQRNLRPTAACFSNLRLFNGSPLGYKNDSPQVALTVCQIPGTWTSCPCHLYVKGDCLRWDAIHFGSVYT